MNMRFLVSVAVLFVVSMVKDFLIHAMFLAPDYAKLPALFRTQEDSQAQFPMMLLAHVLIAVAFVWVYLQGRQDKPWIAQGVRYGVAITVLMVIPGYLIYFAVQPLPGDLVVKQIVYDTIGTVLMGMAVAALNRKT